METQSETPVPPSTDTPPEPQTPQTPPPSILDTEEMPIPPMIPKARFDEVNTRMKKAEAERTQWQEIAEQRALDLASALANLQAVGVKAEETEALHTLIAELVETRKQAVPEHLRTLLDKLSPVDALRWLEANAGKLSARPAPLTDAGARGERGRATLPPEKVLKHRSY